MFLNNKSKGYGDLSFVAAALIMAVFALFTPFDALATAQNIRGVTNEVANQTRLIPQFILYICYCIGVFLIGQSLLKLKAHVESPQNNPLKDGLIRMAVGTLFIALPFTMSLAVNSMTGLSFGGVGAGGTGEATDIDGQALPVGGSPSGQSVGWMVLNIIRNGFIYWPIFIAWISYLVGIFFIVQCGLKLITHVNTPQNMPFAEPVKYFVAGGLMMVLPTVMNIVINTFGLGEALGISAGVNPLNGSATTGLDGMMINLVEDLFRPMDTIITVFCVIAGIIFAFMGLQRLTKTEREGPRGPLGFGTLMLFLVSGILMSMGSTIGTVTQTFFGTTQVTNTVAILGFSSDVNLEHATNVLGAIVQFMMIVGLISFVRGWFLLKAAADGSQQATIMSSVVHIVAGILLINLGPFLNAVQKTLGIDPSVGLQFT